MCSANLEHDQLQLIQELEGHRGYINSLCFDDEGGLLYSGDSQGQIRVWNSYCTDQPSKKGECLSVLHNSII